jgi:hypothetical protein
LIPFKDRALTGSPFKSFNSNDGNFFASKLENFISSSTRSTLAKKARTRIGRITIKNRSD